jgi:4,5-DOPA dioxygenase extradiol
MYPSLFISHGAPNTVLYDYKAKANLKNFAKTLEKPKYIVMVSPHWCTKDLRIINPSVSKIMYDFYGFEKELYEVTYEISSDESYTKNLLNALEDFNPQIDFTQKNFDHGIWTVLMMMYKQIDVPIIQISLPMNYSNKQLFDIGVALQCLKDEAMIIASGSLTHNLRTISFNSNNKDKRTIDFVNNVDKIIEVGDFEKIIYSQNIKDFYNMHPTDEHFKPLLIALGASKNHKGHGFNNEILHGTLSMQSYVFKE